MDNLDDLSINELEIRKKRAELQNEIKVIEGQNGWKDTESQSKRKHRSIEKINEEMKQEKENPMP